MSIDHMIQRIDMQVKQLEAGPMGTNGPDDARWIAGMIRGLRIARRFAEDEKRGGPRSTDEIQADFERLLQKLAEGSK